MSRSYACAAAVLLLAIVAQPASAQSSPPCHYFTDNAYMHSCAEKTCPTLQGVQGARGTCASVGYSLCCDLGDNAGKLWFQREDRFGRGRSTCHMEITSFGTTECKPSTNGVVHVIDGVLMPPTKNIVDLAVATPTLSTLVTALTAGKLTTALSAKGPFTVFAPTNEAFAALPEATLASLLDPKNIQELDSILEYHVISGAAVYAEDLQASQYVQTLEGQKLQITLVNGSVTVQNAKVTMADVQATNGVVHVIDGVLMPPKAVTELAELADTEITLEGAKCCTDCVAPQVKYFSVDVPHGFCGETCIRPRSFGLFHLFEKNLTRATDNTPCREQFTPNGGHYTNYTSTVSHGGFGLKVTLDLYGPVPAK